jgi:indole-3-glycerol phosphate synthase/phosphoribosylanthranilate isomerase
VAEARIAGADAVLVMLSLLDDQEAGAMIGEAARFGMDALVEVHDEREMQRALALGAPLIGINNRDLRDLSIDLATTERLAPMARGRTLVAESGIRSRGDVQRLSARVDGFLVGTSLMRADDPAQAARELIFGRVKLCGLNHPRDIEAGAPAAYAGFIFVPGSPRHITADRAAPLAGQARRLGMLPVGVFRDAPLAIVAEIAALLNLRAVQLNGRENVEYVKALKREIPRDCEVWTACAVGRDALSTRGGDRVLFDNGDGGTGRTFDWRVVANHPRLRSAIVAGGIGPANAPDAMKLGAFAIDVGSSLDRRPGIKCPDRLRSLFEGLRQPCRQELRQCA